MSHMTSTSSVGPVDQIEGWFDSVYNDLKGFIFGSKTTSTSALPRPTGSTVQTKSEIIVTHTDSESSYAALSPSRITQTAAPSVVTVTQVAKPTADAMVTVTHTVPTKINPSEFSTSSLPVTALNSSVPSVSAPHQSSNVNLQTLGFAGLGALIVILVYLLTPIVVRLFQFTVNATKLLFSRSSSFSKDSEMGLSSDSFSLTANIDNEDPREGLGKKEKLRILWYMLRFGESFDEARLRYVLHQFAQNGIDSEGQPLDPKYVTFDPEQ